MGLTPQHEQPCIILLDLNMPKMGGLEFLKIVKYHEHFNRIPVIVLTTSRENQDRLESFNLGVVGYMVKPIGLLLNYQRLVGLLWC